MQARTHPCPARRAPERGALLLSALLVAACASAPERAPPAPAEPAAEPAAATPAPPPEPPPPPPPKAPKTAAEIPELYGTRCPVPPFTLETPEAVDLAGHRFVVEGSTMRREGGPWKKRLTVGVLGALKDASAGTRKNIQKAARAFKREKVDLVVVNGDLGEDQDLTPVFDALGAAFKVPVLLLSGNMEWTSAFTEAYLAAKARHPHLINGNWTRDVDLGGVHLVTLPGWSNIKFTSSGACRYTKEDVDDVRRIVAPLAERGDVVVLVGHGPPRGKGKRALDFAHDAGNVGDEHLRALLDEVPVRFGLFSHILESGGRAARSLDDDKGVLKLPVKRPVPRLYLNAGSASAFPWGMLDGSVSEGMAMVFRLEKGKATAKAVQLGRRRRK